MVSHQKLDVIDELIAQYPQGSVEEDEIVRKLAIKIFGMPPEIQDKLIHLLKFCNSLTESGDARSSTEEIRQYWNHLNHPN